MVDDEESQESLIQNSTETKKESLVFWSDSNTSYSIGREPFLTRPRTLPETKSKYSVHQKTK